MSKDKGMDDSSARKEIDQLLDMLFDNESSCHEIKDVAIWHLLTVFEDMNRFRLSGANEFNLKALPFHIDKAKYALKHALDIIKAKSQPIRVSLYQKVCGETYTKSFNLLKFGASYQRLYREISSSFNGRAEFKKVGEEFEVVVPKSYNLAYVTLEALGHGQKPVFDILILAIAVMSENIEEFKKSKYEDIRDKILDISNARIKKKIVTYKYNAEYAEYLSRCCEQRPTIIPDDYSFPWGEGWETQILINSLMLRCLYHLLVVESLAQKLQPIGGNHQSLVLKITKGDLIQDIGELATNINHEDIKKFIDFLIYGNQITNPDPALQPLFSTLTGDILIPCNLIISNNFQRNLLSLYTRVASSAFDNQSKIFETSMINEANSWVSKLPFALVNEHIVADNKREEVDILIIDENDKFILVMEFRWFIQPGDSREVQERIKVCNQKVTQTERKLAFITKNIKEITKKYNVSSTNSEEWEVQGCVVIKGFGGQQSINDEIPIITLDVLSIGAQEQRAARHLFNWIKSKSWLPLEHCHYERKTEKVELAKTIVTVTSIEVKISPDEYSNFVYETLVNLKE
jgi:hypothetical protein